MKRDMDLIRELLLRIESFEIEPGGTTPGLRPAFDTELQIDGYTPDHVDYHLNHLIDAGLVDGQCGADHFFILQRLTWAGHDFLDSVRDPEIWRATKDGATKAGGFTVELLGDLAKGLIKTQVKKYTGVEF
jgi:hypothetical protein